MIALNLAAQPVVYIGWIFLKMRHSNHQQGQRLQLKSMTIHAAFMVSKQYETLEHKQIKQKRRLSLCT